MKSINLKPTKKRIMKGARATCGMLLAFMLGSSVVLNSEFVAAASDDVFISQKPEYSRQELYDEEIKLNVEMCEEGFVLMKNDNGYLPLKTSANDNKKYKVSMFGNNAYEYAYFGFGSSDTSGIGALPDGSVWEAAYAARVELYQAIERSDTFELNPTLKNFYLDESRSGKIRMGGDSHSSLDQYTAGLDVGETPITSYGEAELNSLKEYNDLAIVVITRPAAEGADLAKTSLKNWDAIGESNKLDSARYWDDHALQLDKNEVDMLQLALKNFDDVIVLINSCAQFEVGFLDDSNHYLYTDNGFATTDEEKTAAMNKIKAAMFISYPGRYGATAVPRILDGTVNPSGKLADTWMRNFKDDPTWQNQGYAGNKDDIKNGDYFVHYDEDIYVGYRYYETRYVTEGTKAAGNEWYHANVIYPFGYGLSYTQFAWSDVEITTSSGTLEKDGKIAASVTVTNIGDVPGKDVVQLYYNAPYISGGIEKSHVVLGDFAKTSLLQPNQSEDITIEIDVSDMKSYDWADLNKNSFKGYELDAGDYNIILAHDAHDAAQLPESRTQRFNLAEGIKYELDPETGNSVGNLFDEVSSNPKGVQVYMSRSDFEGTFPTPSKWKKENLPQQGKQKYTIDDEYDAANPWYSEEEFTQAETPRTYEQNEVKLWHLRGRDYDDPMWDELLNQLTAEEMAKLIGTGAYSTMAMPNIDKPFTKENDGPLGNRFCLSIQWQSAIISAQTFNRELTYKQGRLFGNGCMYPLNQYTGGTYGPGLETHRSPFAGRNMEYYSEDPVLGGEMCAPFMKGTWEMGAYQLLKHFVLNNCETERNSISTWASEQAIREVYAKAYEIVVKDGNCVGMMSAVSYLGDMPCTTNWALLTGLLRNEWGFKGFVISDALYQDVELSIRAGNDLMLFENNCPAISEDKLTTTQLYNIRKSAKNILFVIANSLCMDGYGGSALSGINYTGPSKLYAVQDKENTIYLNTATYTRSSKYPITYTLSADSDLPEGMTFNSDGTITGAATTAGTYRITVSAEEDVPESVLFPYAPSTQNYQLVVYDKNELPEEIMYEEVDIGVVPYGYEYSKNIASAVTFLEDGTVSSSATYSLAPGSKLPAGLKLENGIISGTTYEPAGSYFFTIVVSHKGKPDKTCDIVCTIKDYTVNYPAKDLADLTVGTEVEIGLNDATMEDNAKITYRVKSSTPLPEGLALTGNGVLYGTPLKAYEDYSFTVIASAENATPTEVTYKINIKGLVFNNTTFDDLILGKKYEFKLNAFVNDGTQQEVFYRVKNTTGNQLPTGFVLLGDGTLIGTAQDLGNVSFVVEAVAEGGAIAEAKVTLVMGDVYEDEYDENVDFGPIVTPVKADGLSEGAIAGIVIGCVAVLCIAVFVTVTIVKKKKDGRGSSDE